MGTRVWRFLSRGPGEPMPEDELLLDLVPGGAAIAYEGVQQQFVAARRALDTDWSGITASEWGWVVLLVDGAAASAAIRSAIDRRVLICTPVLVETPDRPSHLAAFFAALARRLGLAPAQPPPALPAHSRAEAEAAAVLDALGF